MSRRVLTADRLRNAAIESARQMVIAGCRGRMVTDPLAELIPGPQTTAEVLAIVRNITGRVIVFGPRIETGTAARVALRQWALREIYPDTARKEVA